MDPSSTLEVARVVGGHIATGSLQVGAFSGCAGLAFGGVAGLFRSSTPALFAFASGIQCSVIGTSFWAARQSALIFLAQRHSLHVSEVPRNQRIIVSTCAGGLSGITAAILFRGRSNVLPGALVFSLIGFTGQKAIDTLDDRRAQPEMVTNKPSLWERLAKSRFSPVTVLSNEDYERILQEKLIRVEAELGLINEDLKHLKESTKNDNSTKG